MPKPMTAPVRNCASAISDAEALMIQSTIEYYRRQGNHEAADRIDAAASIRICQHGSPPQSTDLSGGADA